MSGIANWQAQIRIDIEDLKKRIRVAEGEINNFTNEDRKVKLDIDTKTLESAIQKLDKMLDSLGKGTGDFKQFENLSKELSSIVLEVQSLSKAFGKVDDSGAKTLLSSIQNIDKSLSELSQNILNVNKNMSNMGGNTNGAVKQIENITNESKKAASTLEDVAKAQAKVNGQKTNISSASNPVIEQQNKLQEELKETQSQLENTTKSFETMAYRGVEAEEAIAKASKNYNGATHWSTDEKIARGHGDFVEYGKISLGNAFEIDGNGSAWDKITNLGNGLDENSKKAIEFSSSIEKVYAELSTLVKYDDQIDRFNPGFALYSSIGEEISKLLEEQKSQDNSESNIILQKIQRLAELRDKYSDLVASYNEFSRDTSHPYGIKTTDELTQYAQNNGFDGAVYKNILDAKHSPIVNADEYIKASDVIVSFYDTQVEHLEKITRKGQEYIRESISNLNQKKDAFPDQDVSASVESVTNSIKEENNVLEQNTQKVKENTQAKEQNANVNLNGYDKRLDSYQGKINKYDTTIKRFEDGGWTSDTYLKNVQAVRDAVKQYATLLDHIKTNQNGIASDEDIQNLDKYEKKIKDTIATVTNMSASEKGYSKLAGQKEIDKINKILRENSAMTSEAKAKIKAYKQELISGNPSASLEKIHGEIMKIVNAEELAGRTGRSFFDTLKNSGFHQIAAQMAGMVGVYDVINVVKEGINTVRELDTAMTEVRKVSNATESQYDSFRDTISSTAKEIATTNKELLNSSADFLRLGYSLEQAEDLAKNATLFVNVGDGVDITEATEDMITAMKAFDIQAEDSIKIVDDYNQIGNKYALSATDIGEAMKRSASALEVGNNSFEESIGLITAMNEIVQNSENTGNSLKVLSLRLRGAKAELEDMGEDTDGLCDSTSKLREQVKALSGVDIMEDDNTFKSTAQQVKELGEAFVKLDDVSQAALLEIIAGKSRSNAVAALLKNYQQIDNVIADLDDAEGSALRENEAIVDSIDGRIKVLSATAEEFWQKFIDTDFVKNAVSLASDLLGLLTQIIDKFGTLPTIVTGIGAALSFKNVGEWNYISKFHSNNIICFIV